MAKLINQSIEYENTITMIVVRSRYSEIGADVTEDIGQRVWIEEDLSDRAKRLRSLSRCW